MSTFSSYDRTVIQMIKSLGYVPTAKIGDTLQGSVWNCFNPSTKNHVVLKCADQNRSQNQVGIVNHQEYKVQENIHKESHLLQYLCSDAHCPKSIIQYLSSIESDDHHVLIMEHGGNSLFDFVQKAHRFIHAGCLDIAEWHAMVRVILSQILECVDYLHSKNVCHFDLSLENFVVNDVQIDLIETPRHKGDKQKIKFCIDDADSVQIKCIDFGLAERFANANNHRFASSKYCGKRCYASPEISSHKERFDAQRNDVWCVGVCFFMMVIGSAPFQQSVETDDMFNMIMNGELITLLSHWEKLHFVNVDIMRLLSMFFKWEEHRCTIQNLKQCHWLKLK
eukprot:57690_1